MNGPAALPRDPGTVLRHPWAWRLAALFHCLVNGISLQRKRSLPIGSSFVSLERSQGSPWLLLLYREGEHPPVMVDLLQGTAPVVWRVGDAWFISGWAAWGQLFQFRLRTGGHLTGFLHPGTVASLDPSPMCEKQGVLVIGSTRA